jgi:hypothetical protein
MKTRSIASKTLAIGAFLLSLGLQAQHQHGEGEAHTHYREHDDFLAHKLLFPSKVPDRVITNLTEDPAHSFAVNWRTNQQIQEAFVEVAVATDGPGFLLNNPRRITANTEMFENQNRNEPLVKAAFHSALVDGLEPNTTYVYRVGNGGVDNRGWSEWFQFTTAQEGDAPFSFIYFGDAQNQVKSMWSRVIRNSYRKFPEVDFMLHAGDLINDRDANIEWGEWFHAGSFIHATVPSIMTPGNHEYRDGVLSSLWRPQFNLPQNGPIAALKETCFALDYQGMKLVSIDAEGFDESEAAAKAQVQWLDSVLAANTQKWTAITMHYPIYSTVKGRDNKELRKALKPLIDKYKVDLVVQGHDHTYARGYAENNGKGMTKVDDIGTIYTVSVSGPKMYESKDQKWMERRGEFTQLFQIITVNGDRINYEAYTPIGTLYDAFDLIKKDGKKTMINRIPDSPVRLKKDLIKDK